MKAFDVPGPGKGGGELVDARTISFQIGSTTKAFLAASMAITVDHGKVHWDDQVIDLDPDFQLARMSWVTREFRVSSARAARGTAPDALGSSASTRSR